MNYVCYLLYYNKFQILVLSSMRMTQMRPKHVAATQEFNCIYQRCIG